MEKVNNRLWNLSEDDMIQEQLEAKEKQRRDQSSREKWALKKGREEGREKGREEGREEERKQLALKMLEEGESMAKICKYTKLTKKEIEALKTEKKVA